MRISVRSPWLPLVAASLWLAPAAMAVTFDWVTVGDPGNARPERHLRSGG